MEDHFLTAVDAAVARALPGGWPRLPPERLPARGGVRARHAFRLAVGAGPAPYLAIVALPLRASTIPEVQCDLVELVDHVLARGAGLLLLEEDGDGHPDDWIPEHLDFPHPRFLGLPCLPGDEAREAGVACGGPKSGRSGACGGYLAELAGGRWEPLAEVIHDLWSGNLAYHGPGEGVQTVGLEVMSDQCWRCHAALDLVTGIVFPDREVGDWSLPDWSWFQGLLTLAAMPDALAPALAAAVEAWRAAGDRRLSAIRWRFSQTARRAYWAAECTVCGALQGDFPVTARRLRRLDERTARRNGILSYRPLRLDIPRQALQELAWGVEAGPHARAIGWRRAGDPGCQGMAAGAPTGGPIQRLGEILSSWLGR
jgi:hypothetical protein